MRPHAIRASAIVFIVAAMSAELCPANERVRLSDNDVYFQFAGITTHTDHVGTNIAPNTKASPNRLCGYTIRGNHRSRQNPHVEWDLNIDEIVAPGQTVAGVSAGTFTVTDHKREPRPPITQLRFTLTDNPEPVIAEVRGSPNRDNGIVALIQSEPAARLFSELQTIRPVIVSMTYSDGSSTELEVRGIRDEREHERGKKNNYFAECLRGFRSPPFGGDVQVAVP